MFRPWDALVASQVARSSSKLVQSGNYWWIFLEEGEEAVFFLTPEYTYTLMHLEFLDVVSDGCDVLLQWYVIICILDWLDEKEIISIQCHLSTIGQRTEEIGWCMIKTAKFQVLTLMGHQTQLRCQLMILLEQQHTVFCLRGRMQSTAQCKDSDRCLLGMVK